MPSLKTYYVAFYWIVMGTLRGKATHPECSIVFHLQEKEAECRLKMIISGGPSLSTLNRTEGCWVEWDGVNCWPIASVGERVSLSCPQVLRAPSSIPIKLIYTVGYGMSLASLISAILVFCIYRKLLCTRTYIHLNLFSSFIWRGMAVLVKDAMLFADESVDHCTMSMVGCKAAVAFFQYCVLANFFWLLVEGLYLQTLLVFTFTPTKKFFWWFIFIGWGFPSVTIVIWILFKSHYDDRGCWDDLDSGLWWIIKGPILLSAFVNFVMFVNIIRIIFQKMKTPDMKGSLKTHYKLTKSTLLLIPLFGVHYMVFALLPDHVGLGPRLCFELILGSFQGFMVALLYCFLNGEVQQEIKDQMRKCLPSNKSNAFNMVTQEYTA